jgi:hypothetical protein
MLSCYEPFIKCLGRQLADAIQSRAVWGVQLLICRFTHRFRLGIASASCWRTGHRADLWQNKYRLLTGYLVRPMQFAKYTEAQLARLFKQQHSRSYSSRNAPICPLHPSRTEDV